MGLRRASAAALATTLVVAGAACVVHAAGVTFASAGLGSGTAPVTACGDLSGAGHTVVDSSGSVTSVTVTGLPAACTGAALSLAVTQAGVSQGEGGPVTVSGGSATVTVTPAVPRGSVGELRIVVSGP